MDLIHQLNWRYMIKRNGENNITPKKLEAIMNTICSSGSAFGLLPHTILALDNNARLSTILPAVNQASHLIVFTAWTGIRHENINELIAYIASDKGLSLDHSDDYKEIMKILVKSKAEYHGEWSTKQAYIALGIGLTVAGEQNIAAFPLDTFDNEALDKLLNLKEKGMRSVAVLALGKHDGSWKTPQKVHTKKPAREREMPIMVGNC